MTAIQQITTENTENLNGLTMLEDKSILVIEDDADIASLIRLHLKEQFRRVEVAVDGREGFDLACQENWNLIILDLRLPHKDGLQVCRELRQRDNTVPILMLTSKSSEQDRITGLESGADDYVAKPFSVMELQARVRAILRRADMSAVTDKKGKTGILNSPDNSISMDVNNYQVLKHGQPIELTAKEFDLLSYFLENPGSVFSRAHLLSRIWGYGHEGYEHTVNSHINRLRAKIETDPTQPRLITTVWGVGYKLV